MTDKSKRVLAIVALVLLLGAIGLCGSCGYLYLLSESGSDEQMAKGRDFGKSTDQRGCLDQSLRQIKEVDVGLSGRAKAMTMRYFARGCFETCKATIGFCDGAPPIRASYSDVSAWAHSQCGLRGFAKGGPCFPVFEDIAKECHVPRPRVP